MSEFEKLSIKELERIRHEVSSIEGWMLPIFIFLFLVWMRGCK